ncbi:MAG: hypothetical protein ACRC5A_15925, partial [Enterobacteriaceae bacterium]
MVPPIAQLPPATTQQLQNQAGIVVIDDQADNNIYITTSISSGMTLSGSAPVALFGVQTPKGNNRYLVTWYPHQRAQDISAFIEAEPAQLFRGVANNNNQYQDSTLNNFTLADTSYVNPLLHQQAVSELYNLAPGGTLMLRLLEQLQDGSQRQVETSVFKQAQLTLRRPATIQCRAEVVEGKSGKACLLREVQMETNGLGGDDLRFVMRLNQDNPDVLYRVGQRWYPMGTPLPLTEFSQGQGVEIFFIPLSAEQLEKTVASLQGKSLDALLEAGFYSASRHGRGDRFGLMMKGNTLPGGEAQYQMSRLEVLLIEDQTNNNHYVTTLKSSGSRGQSARVYGVQQPVSGADHPAVWYAKEYAQKPQSRLALPEVDPVLTPAQNFNSLAQEKGERGSLRAFAPQLSDAGWQQLINMAPGELQQWRYDVEQPGLQQTLISHVVKSGQLQLQRPTKYACQKETVEQVSGWRCLIREINWRGNPVTEGDVRFVVRSKIDAPASRYRVGAEWTPLGDSVPLSEFAQSKGIELFVAESNQESEASWRGASQRPLLELLNMSFFSSQYQDDRFTLQVDSAPFKQQMTQQPLRIAPMADQPPLQMMATHLSPGFVGTSIKTILYVKLGQGTAPIVAPPDKITLKIGEDVDNKLVSGGYVIYYPSNLAEHPDKGDQYYKGHDFHPPIGTVGFYIYLTPVNPFGSAGVVTFPVELSIEGRGSTKIIPRITAEKSEALLYNQIKNIDPEPAFVTPGQTVTFRLGTLVPNLQDTRKYYLFCDRKGSDASISDNNFIDIFGTSDKFTLYRGNSRYRSQSFGEYEPEATITLTGDDLQDNDFNLKFTALKTLPSQTVATLRCKLQATNLKPGEHRGRWVSSSVTALSETDTLYKVDTLTAEEAGEATAVATAVMSTQPVQKETIYYRLRLTDFTQTEINSAKFAWRNKSNTQTWTPVNRNDSGYYQFEGSMSVAQFEYWLPQFQLKVDNLLTVRYADLSVSTGKDFPANLSKQVAMRISPQPLTISLPQKEISANIGEELKLPIELGRQPSVADNLYFQLINQGMPELSDLLELSQARLEIPGGAKESVDLSQPGGAAHLLAGLQSQKLQLVIPGKFSNQLAQEKKFIVRVNWGKSADENSQGAQQANATLIPFKQSLELIPLDGAGVQLFNG